MLLLHFFSFFLSASAYGPKENGYYGSLQENIYSADWSDSFFISDFSTTQQKARSYCRENFDGSLMYFRYEENFKIVQSALKKKNVKTDVWFGNFTVFFYFLK